MSAYQHYELFCDHPSCGESINLGEKRADITRREAAKQGWVHGVVPPAPNRGGLARSLDFCPAHVGDLPADAGPKALPAHARPL